MKAKFEIYQDNKKEYRWRFKGGNHEIVAVSEGYVTKQGCKNGIRVVQTQAAAATVEDLTEAKAYSRW